VLEGRRKRLACIGELPVDHDVRCSRSRPIYASAKVIEHLGDRHRSQHICTDAGRMWMLRAFSKVQGTFGTAAVLLAFILPAGPAALSVNYL
jgi:hypothetical protein